MSLSEIPFYYSASGSREEDEKLLEPMKYIIQIPGKQIRMKLIQAFNYWLMIPNDKRQMIEEIINIFHNSSILIDDIEDNSVLRRGIPVAHSVYGIANTLNTANYLLLIAMEKVNNLQHPAAITVCIEDILELHRGQGMDIFWRDNFTCPTEADYKIMTIRKTGGLFNLAVRLMKLFSSYQADFSSLIATLGLYFQIRDDYCNLCLSEYTESKTYCEDLSEGKFSFPIIHAITNNPNDKEIQHILRKRPKDIEVKRYCVKLLEKFGSFKYTKEILKKLDAKARDEINRLGGNMLLIEILNKLKNWDTKEV